MYQFNNFLSYVFYGKFVLMIIKTGCKMGLGQNLSWEMESTPPSPCFLFLIKITDNPKERDANERTSTFESFACAVVSRMVSSLRGRSDENFREETGYQLGLVVEFRRTSEILLIFLHFCMLFS